MKRLALLAVTAFMAVILSACGESAQKKAENNATSSTQQSQDSLGDAAKDADSKLQQGSGTDASSTSGSTSQPATQSGQ